jgi:hypothetical protein
MLVTVPRGNCDKINPWDAKSCQPERSRSLLIFDFIGATYGATIYFSRGCDLVAIEMLVAAAHGNDHIVECRDARSCQSEHSLSIIISALTGMAHGAVIYSRPGYDSVAIEISPFI